MRRRLLVFVKPSPIPHIDLAAAHGAFPGVLGFAQWPPGDLLTDDGAARKWIFHARDFHLMFRSKKSGPGLLRGPTYTARAVSIRPRRHQVFIVTCLFRAKVYSKPQPERHLLGTM
jgi:hypothetical protein